MRKISDLHSMILISQIGFFVLRSHRMNLLIPARSSRKRNIILEKKRKNNSGSYDGGAKVVTLHITSAILAAKSPFFYKLVKNGMRESQQKNDVSLRITSSEEAPLMDLLNFMYGNTLSATSAPDLINVLIAADKFEVTSCMKYAIQMLLKLSISLENALLYLELPSSVLMRDIVQPLICEAKKYIVARFKDFTKSQEDAMELSLSAIEVVLGSEGLQVTSEDVVYDFILEWARAHYSDLEERREILTKRLARLICFPNMSSLMLKEVLVCPEFEHEEASKLVMEALFSKVEHSCGQHIHSSMGIATTDCNFLGRVYGPHCVFYSPYCVVYFDLKKDELKRLSPSKGINSQTFCLGGRQLFLLVERCQEHDHFDLFVCKDKDSETCTLNYEFAVMKKSSKKFNCMYIVKDHTLLNDFRKSIRLNIPWTELMSDDCDYYIDGILHLRAEITLVNKTQP